jgi:hypothetical protein
LEHIEYRRQFLILCCSVSLHILCNNNT